MKSSCLHFFFNHWSLLVFTSSSITLYSSVRICIRNSLTAPSRTALVPVRYSVAHKLLISLHCSTLKVFTSHVESSQADFFFNCELLAALTANSSNPQLPSTPTAYYSNYPHCTLGNLLYSRSRTAENRVSSVTSYGVSRESYTLLCDDTRACVV
jgi:hypothetical protein